MSPYSCPDFICDLDADETSFVSLVYNQSEVDKEIAYISNVVLDFSDKIEIKLKLKRTNSRIFGYSYGRINYKKSIKFWSKVRSHCKKELKRLRDRGIKGRGNLCELSEQDYMTWANYHNQYLNAEDMLKQSRFYRKDKHRYNTDSVPITFEKV